MAVTVTKTLAVQKDYFDINISFAQPSETLAVTYTPTGVSFGGQVAGTETCVVFETSLDGIDTKGMASVVFTLKDPANVYAEAEAAISA